MIHGAIDWITGLSPEMFYHAFWYSLVFEVPRYLVPALLVTGAALFSRPQQRPRSRITGDRVSVLVVGHNEGGSIRRCVLSLHEQTLKGVEIICISDGSSDRMASEIRLMEREGLIDRAVTLSLRGGKAAGVNLAAGLASRDILVVVDCDSSYERDCLERLIAPFADPTIGVVSGNLHVRNAGESLIAGLQAIEYLISIDLGKRVSNLLDQVTCASGALQAFRMSVVRRIGCMNATGGEDLDFTLRAREAGIGVIFAHDAVCYTDVPRTLSAFLRQRKRWEGDAIDVRLRRHGFTLNPFDRRFALSECYHQLEFIFSNVVAAITFPVYVLMMFAWHGSEALLFMLGVLLVAICADLFLFTVANLVAGRHARWGLLLHCLIYSLFQTLVVRVFRANVYVREAFLRETLRDSYRPAKVRFH